MNDKVVFYCKFVIESCPSNDKAHFRMAQALHKLGDYEKAVESCIQAQKYQTVKGKYTLHLFTNILEFYSNYFLHFYRF